ncbi:MAG: glycerophosphodiester phosphodiesterase [Draconibacterium sp.]|nr:glycerophosphodiester phosphodiesterase [Draconibacterium sp.]
MKIYVTAFLIFFVLNMNAQNTFIAHRGASFDAPENTVTSAKLAWELGADAVECDIHLSKDNRIMVIHDKDTKRTCSGKKNLSIAEYPSTLLRDLDAGVWKDVKFKGEKIPFLSELIETVPEGKKLVVEIKCGTEVIPPLERIMEKCKKQEQIVFIAFDWKTIIETKKAFPQNKCYWLSSSKNGLGKKIREAAENGLNGVNLHYSAIDEEIMQVAKENNMEVLSWTIDDPAEAKRLIDLGVTKLTTNRPAWLKEEIGKL